MGAGHHLGCAAEPLERGTGSGGESWGANSDSRAALLQHDAEGIQQIIQHVIYKSFSVLRQPTTYTSRAPACACAHSNGSGTTADGWVSVCPVG